VLFWTTMAGFSNGGLVNTGGLGPIKGRPPQALLWFNPFAAQYDVICGASDGYGGWCSRLNTITNGAISVGSSGAGGSIIPTPGTNFGSGVVIPPDQPVDKTLVVNGSAGGATTGGGVFQGAPFAATDPQPFGVKRDTFWPRSLRAWAVMSVIFILASIQLVSPTRRWRILRRPMRRTTG